jgi:phosphatidylserine decarboxylase
MPRDILKTAPQYVVPKKELSVFAGFMANLKNQSIKNYLIQHFIKKYQVNMQEALIEDPTAYATFNNFFIRHLKPECRPLAAADIISPVDGCVSELGAIEAGQLIQAKGKKYSVEELLACDKSTAETFSQGQFATLYLSPKDYHRVHMPLDAQLVSMNYIPGALFSVQPATARVVPKLFARNERLAVLFETHVGPMAMVLVGATIVGSIGTTWHGDIKRSKQEKTFTYSPEQDKTDLGQGDEMGYFKLGSTVVLLFANGKHVQWNPSLKAGSSIRFGEGIGTFS